MGIESYFCCWTASLLPGNGVVERRSRSQWLHYAPAMKVLRIRKCLIVETRSVRRASGLLERLRIGSLRKLFDRSVVLLDFRRHIGNLMEQRAQGFSQAWR
jgi:hypothetical protein